jgi:hypothetical protein
LVALYREWFLLTIASRMLTHTGLHESPVPMLTITAYNRVVNPRKQARSTFNRRN